MSQMRKLFVWNTRIGPFYITELVGRYHPVFNDQSLGSYARPEKAAVDLACGQTFSVVAGVDTSEMGIPSDLSEWQRVPGSQYEPVKRPKP